MWEPFLGGAVCSFLRPFAQAFLSFASEASLGGSYLVPVCMNFGVLRARSATRWVVDKLEGALTAKLPGIHIGFTTLLTGYARLCIEECSPGARCVGPCRAWRLRQLR